MPYGLSGFIRERLAFGLVMFYEKKLEVIQLLDVVLCGCFEQSLWRWIWL